MRMTIVALWVCAMAGPALAEEPVRWQSGEVIVLEGKAPPSTPPRPTNFVHQKAPPYSDEAILSDAWTKAWLLLEIDERGVVTRFKFLKRPGYQLEDIARAEAFRLRFTPAKDGSGKAMRSTLLWEIEWPSAFWL